MRAFRVDFAAGFRQADPMNFDERFDRYFARKPSVHPTAFIAPGAVVIGDVTLGEGSSIWYHCVLRADINAIRIGAHSNIQDGTVIHLEDNLPVEVGEYVTCGHQALLHACTIGNEVLVGMGAIILDGAVIGERSIIGAGSLVTKNKVIPPGSMVMGSPARVVRALTPEEQLSIKPWAEKYVMVAEKHRAGQKSVKL